MSRFATWLCFALFLIAAHFSTAFGFGPFDGWTFLTIPVMILLLVGVHLLWAQSLTRLTRTTPLTVLAPEAVHALRTQAHAARLHVDAIRHRPLHNAMMVWTGWRDFKTTWVILYDEHHYAHLSDVETHALIYHEMGHGLNRDPFWRLSLYGLLFAWLFAICRIPFYQGLQLYPILLMLALLLMAVGISQLMLRLVFHPREYQADGWACRLAGTPQPMISALQGMMKHNATAPKNPAWYDWLVNTHPTPAQRIAYLAQWQAAPPPPG